MKRRNPSVGFALSVSGRNDGTIEALYISLSQRKVKKTKEIVEDVLLVDYDSQGGVVGIEILAPVRISRVTRLVGERQREPLRRFIEQSAPEELVHA